MNGILYRKALEPKVVYLQEDSFLSPVSITIIIIVIIVIIMVVDLTFRGIYFPLSIKLVCRPVEAPTMWLGGVVCLPACWPGFVCQVPRGKQMQGNTRQMT